MTEKELTIFEKGFEEGYETAKRIYEPKIIRVFCGDDKEYNFNSKNIYG